MAIRKSRKRHCKRRKSKRLKSRRRRSRKRRSRRRRSRKRRSRKVFRMRRYGTPLARAGRRRPTIRFMEIDKRAAAELAAWMLDCLLEIYKLQWVEWRHPRRGGGSILFRRKNPLSYGGNVKKISKTFPGSLLIPRLQQQLIGEVYCCALSLLRNILGSINLSSGRMDIPRRVILRFWGLIAIRVALKTILQTDFKGGFFAHDTIAIQSVTQDRIKKDQEFMEFPRRLSDQLNPNYNMLVRIIYNHYNNNATRSLPLIYTFTRKNNEGRVMKQEQDYTRLYDLLKELVSALPLAIEKTWLCKTRMEKQICNEVMATGQRFIVRSEDGITLAPQCIDGIRNRRVSCKSSLVINAEVHILEASNWRPCRNFPSMISGPLESILIRDSSKRVNMRGRPSIRGRGYRRRYGGDRRAYRRRIRESEIIQVPPYSKPYGGRMTPIGPMGKWVETIDVEECRTDFANDFDRVDAHNPALDAKMVRFNGKIMKYYENFGRGSGGISDGASKS